MTTDRDLPEPSEMKVSPAGGTRLAVILVFVMALIAAAVTFMLFAVGTEGSERSDPPTTTIQ